MKKFFSFCTALVFMLLSSINSSAIYGLSQSIDLKDEVANIEVSAPMAYEESVERYAQLNNISYEEALDIFPARPAARAANFTSRELVVTLDVTSIYKPTLHFLCETSEGSSPSMWGILNIYSAQMVRSYNGTSYRFDGIVEFWLRSAYQIEYVVNGDFYANSTTSSDGSFSGQVNIGEYGSFSFTVSGGTSSNHYTYFYDHKTKAFQ